MCLALQVKVRHGPQMHECSFALHPDGGMADVKLEIQDQGLATGQYAVFYQDGYCLGASKILSTSSV